jgi:hypothetical protein
MKPIELLCYGCGTTGVVPRVTASLRCRCGSRDLDLYVGSLEQREASWRLQQRRAAAIEVSFADWMTREAAAPAKAAPVGGDVPGWNEYTGPRPTPSQEQNGIGTPLTCPICHGSGFDIQDGGRCRTCGGSGVLTPNTDAETPAVARHDYPSNQTTVPYMGKKRTRKSAGREAAELAPLVATIKKHNPGLSEREILTLGRQTLTYARTAEKS